MKPHTAEQPAFVRNHRLLAAAAALALAFSSTRALPASPSAEGCKLNPADLSKTLGIAFNAGAADIGIGPACIYNSKDGNSLLWLGFIPQQGSFDAMKMYIGPPSTKYTPVANDADQARLVATAAADNAIAHIAYLRRGQLVQLHLGGAILAGAQGAQRATMIAELNRKLLALPRVP
jgi:hypothetical protein